MQVCPTVTPGPPPVGIRVYLRTATLQVAVSAKASTGSSYHGTPEVPGGCGGACLYHTPSFGWSTGSRTGSNSIAVGTVCDIQCGIKWVCIVYSILLKSKHCLWLNPRRWRWRRSQVKCELDQPNYEAIFHSNTFTLNSIHSGWCLNEGLQYGHNKVGGDQEAKILQVRIFLVGHMVIIIINISIIIVIHTSLSKNITHRAVLHLS